MRSGPVNRNSSTAHRPTETGAELASIRTGEADEVDANRAWIHAETMSKRESCQSQRWLPTRFFELAPSSFALNATSRHARWRSVLTPWTDDRGAVALNAWAAILEKDMAEGMGREEGEEAVEGEGANSSVRGREPIDDAPVEPTPDPTDHRRDAATMTSDTP